jgi:hypothetical protein
MGKIVFILALFVSGTVQAQEADDNLDDSYYDTGMAGGITIYGERSIDTHVLNQLNGSASDRKQFIETEFLEVSGFRRTGNVRYRKSTGSEKALSVLHGIGHLLSLDIIPVPMKPFSEIEHDRLPKGEYYTFESVFVKSNFTKVSPEIAILMELEYMLQIEFGNGIIIQDTLHYYTDENIAKFEGLIFGLPDYPESIYRAKNRYANELKKIKAALERYKNPGEYYLRAMENWKSLGLTK